MPKFFQFLCLYFLLSGSFFAAGQNVTGVSSTASDGSYKVGDVIPITVEFSEVVNVSGTPQLTLETGSSDAVVNYSSGTGTNTLTFNYTVGSDHSSSDLDYVATSSLALPEPNPGTPVYEDTDGSAHGVTISGNYAYIADETSGLAIIDISDPTNPGTPVYKATSYKAKSVAVSGNYAYVIDQSSGLAIIDISDKANPGSPSYTATNANMGTALAVAVSGNYAYVAASFAGLVIINISDPTSPGTPNYYDTNGMAFGVTVSGNYAYVADRATGLAIFDISNPASPGTPIYVDTNGEARGVAISGNYAYVADKDAGLAIIDISDPTSPGTPVYVDTNGEAKGIAISGNYAYVADKDAGLAIIDISDPTNPGNPVYRDTNDEAKRVTISGNYAYVADGTSGLAIIPLNVSNITDTSGSGATLTLPSPGATNSLGANKAILIDNTDPTVSNVTSTAANGSYKVGNVIPIIVEFSEVVNVSGTPQLTLETGSSDAVVNYSSGTGTNSLTFNYTVASDHTTSDLDYVATNSLLLPTPNPGTPVYRDTDGVAHRVTVNGNYAYVGDGSSGVAIINITDPTNPGTPVYRDTNFHAYEVAISGNYAYVADGYSGLAIIDISDPTNPGTPVYRDTDAYAWGVTVSGNYAYLSDGYSGLAIIDITDPTNPGTPIYRDTNGAALGVTISGNYAYLADNDSGLAIIDITDPTNPGTPVYRDINGDALRVAISGNYAYLANNDSGLAIIDISDPTNPGTPVYRDTNGVSYGVTVSGNYAYLADNDSGLAIIDISNPASPGTPVYIDTNGAALDVTISGNYAYVGNDIAGLAIIPTNAGSINDIAGNAATLVLASPGAANSLGANKAIVVDNTDPTVSNVTSTAANGSYKVGDVIPITIEFSEVVNVTGTPQLTLETGSSDAVVDYSSGTGSNTLTFNYTVASDHTTSDLDYVTTSSFALNSGTINDAAVNAATLTLASPGASGSLGTNKAIVVDGTVPTMSITANEGIDGFTAEDSTLSLTFASSEAIADFILADITITGGTISSLVAVNDSTYTATFTASGEGAKTILVAVGAYKDVAGNENIAAAQFNWTYDVDNAPQISDTTFSLAENSPNGTFFGTIQASDADGDTLSYTVLSGNTDQAFGLNASTGVLSVTDSTALDYETAPVFSLLVQASDGALSDSATVIINLIDVEENVAPTITAATFTLAENISTGTVVGTIGASDTDGDTLAYAILTGNTDQAFGLNVSTGVLSVTDSTALDYETTPVFSLLVQASDGALSDSATVTINLIDVEENVAPTITVATFILAENSPNGTFVGTIQASDADGDTLSYTILSGNTDQAFGLNASTGVLSVTDSTALDYETAPVFSLLVQASDGALSDSATVTINLIDIDEEEEEETLSLADASAMIYPNPSNGIVNIKMAALKEATIYNLSGKRIMRSTDNRIDVSTLSEGVYIIKLENKSGDRFSTRLIKE